MQEIIPTTIVILVWGALAARVRGTALEQRCILLSWVAHVLSVFGAVYLSGDGGDLAAYVVVGRSLARFMRDDFLRCAPQVIGLFFHSDDFVMGDDFTGVGTSTGSMKALASFVMLLVDDSTYASCMLITIPSFFGKLALYRAFRDSFPQDRFRLPLLLATVLTPSVVFWSCGFVKEGIVISALGWMLLGLRAMWSGSRLTGAFLVLVPGLFVATIKGYVLFPFVMASGVWFLWDRARTSQARGLLNPIYLLLGAAAALGGLVALGAVFPQYSIGSLGEEAARYQEIGQEVTGGSSYLIGDPGERSLAGQLAFAPLALATALSRPLPFEVHNVTAAAAALEMVVLFVLLVQTISRLSWRETARIVYRSPLLMFSVTFVVLFGTAVGLATTNLGTLSRYRLPLMPFYALTVLVLHRSRLGLPAEEELAEAEAAPPVSTPAPAPLAARGDVRAVSDVRRLERR